MDVHLIYERHLQGWKFRISWEFGKKHHISFLFHFDAKPWIETQPVSAKQLAARLHWAYSFMNNFSEVLPKSRTLCFVLPFVSFTCSVTYFEAKEMLMSGLFKSVLVCSFLSLRGVSKDSDTADKRGALWKPQLSNQQTVRNWDDFFFFFW